MGYMRFEGGNFTPKPAPEAISPSSKDVENVLEGLNAIQARLAIAAYKEHHQDVPETEIDRNEAMFEWVESNAKTFRDLVDTDPGFRERVLNEKDAAGLRAVLETIEGKSPLH